MITPCPRPRQAPRLTRAALLIVVLAVMAGPFAAARAQTSPSMEAAVLDEINAARADPHAYADYLRRYRAYYHGQQVNEPGRPVAMTNEGVAAVDDAIAYLDKQSPMAPLQASPALSASAKRLADDLAARTAISHVASDGSTMSDRIRAAGVQAGAMEEDISVAQPTARAVVRSLIIDDGVTSRGHRTALFTPDLKIAGAACGPQVQYRTVCVIDFAGVLMAQPGSEQDQQTASADSPASPNKQQDVVPGEVLLEISNETSPARIEALDKRVGLETLEFVKSELTGTTLVRSHILGGRSIEAVLAAVGTGGGVISAQPNYVFTLQAGASAHAPPESTQYAADKLRLAQAHTLARGRNVFVGILDTGVEADHPELRGVIAGSYDALSGPADSGAHGTAVASLIAGRGRLQGSAPDARILAVRAFSADGPAGRGTGLNLVKGLNWLAANGARVVNMSFAGPNDPDLRNALDAAYRHGMILVAAAGNAGPSSPPLYPAADPDVIAVSATDADDRIYTFSNRGPYIRIAAPGVDLLVASQDDGYTIESGTSFSAAEVSGVAALLLQAHPGLAPAKIRAILLATARDAGGRDAAAPKIVDAFRAVQESGR